jgi:nicotinamide riboside kinase
MNSLKEKFSPKYIVYVLPEVAATTVGAGVTIIPSEFTPDTHKVFTEGIMKMQMDLEDYFYAIASIQKKDVIILTDRGVMDNTAYCTPEVEQRIYDSTGWTKSSIRDDRYDLVIHLVTAADGAESFYTLENNAARTETPEVAKWLDGKTQAVWNGHPHHVIIDNNVKNFNEKLDNVYKAIGTVLDVPEAANYLKKYLIKGSFDPAQIPEEFDRETFHEQITYLSETEENHLCWLKERTDNNGGKYLSYTKRRVSEKESERLELKRRVDGNLFKEYMTHKDENRNTVNKDLTMFIWKNRSYMVEAFKMQDGAEVNVLRFSHHQDGEEVEIPDFIEVGDDISENPTYFSFNMSNPNFEQ